jgi:hypothetical protein
VSTRTFELATYPELVEAWTTPDDTHQHGVRLAYAIKHGRVWRCYREGGGAEVSAVATKPQAQQRVRQYATEALTSGGGS